MDWARAGMTAGFGLIGVFIILLLLYLSTWVTSSVVFRIVSRKDKKTSKEEQ